VVVVLATAPKVYLNTLISQFDPDCVDLVLHAVVRL
jgi:hypothetical protein